MLCAHVSCLGTADYDLSMEDGVASLPRDDAIQILSPSSSSSRADGANTGDGVVSLGGESAPKVAASPTTAALGESLRAGRRGKAQATLRRGGRVLRTT